MLKSGGISMCHPSSPRPGGPDADSSSLLSAGRAGVAESGFLKRPPRFPAHGWTELAELPAKSSLTESFLATVPHLIFKYLGQLMQATTMQIPLDKGGSPWSVPLPPVPRERRPGAILACTNPCSPVSCEGVSRRIPV